MLQAMDLEVEGQEFLRGQCGVREYKGPTMSLWFLQFVFLGLSFFGLNAILIYPLFSSVIQA